MDYKARQQNVRRELEKRGLDALLVTHLPNVRYLCGFTGSAAALLVDTSQTILFTDGRYTTQARAEVQRSCVIIGRKAPLLTAAECFQRNQKHSGTQRKRRLGVEADHLTVSERQRLSRALPSNVQLGSVSQLVEKVRMIKDSEEINRIRAAVLLGSKLFDVVLKAVRPGVRETDVAAELEYAARKAGTEGMSFETIIASGSRSALPHGRASSARIPRGFVVCDFGVILAGYCSDMTRTVHVGRPSAEARRIYDAVREAQQAAIAAVIPGVSLSEVDRAARTVLKRKGLGRYFTHSTGHGVGLEIHEAPRVASGQEEVLQPGMVITIEPGVYLPGKCGIRIEDMVVVTENGCEVLTPAGKEMVVV